MTPPQSAREVHLYDALLKRTKICHLYGTYPQKSQNIPVVWCLLKIDNLRSYIYMVPTPKEQKYKT